MEVINENELTGTANDHARAPRNHGPLAEYNGRARQTGRCGDTMEFWLRVQDGEVARASFVTDGCAPSLAAGSMATCLAEGRPLADAAGIAQKDVLEALGGLPEESEHCAHLAASTLKEACLDAARRREPVVAEHPAPGGTACAGCDDSSCSASARREGESRKEFAERQRLRSRLCRIRHKLVVLSGKGGVGKSTIAVNLAAALAMSGKKVGLLDVDVHGPSVPTMLGLEGQEIHGSEEGMLPVDAGGLKVMSLGFLLRGGDDAVIWRGPMKANLIREFLAEVAWGELDYLVIDSPPGTGDEPLSVCQLVGDLDGAIVVTTPQKVAAVDVRKSISFCRHLQVPVLGIVENMSGFACPKCGEVTPILRSGGGLEIAAAMDVPLLGSIPLDPQIAEACDDGQAYLQRFAGTPTARAMREAIRPILALDGEDGTEDAPREGRQAQEEGGIP
jgi:Mrp family chromosome partitioning ATPase